MDNDPSKLLDQTSEASAKSAAEPPLSPSPEDVMADLERRGAAALRIKAERDEAVRLLRKILDLPVLTSGPIFDETLALLARLK